MKTIRELLNNIAHRSYEEITQNITGNLSPLSSSAPLSSFGYMNINRPNDVPTNAIAEIHSTNGQGWLMPMSGGTYRLIVPGTTSGSRTLTIVWRYKIGGVS